MTDTKILQYKSVMLEGTLSEKMKCIWELRDMEDKKLAVQCLMVGFEKDKSVLLRHELCYVIGQIGELSAIPCLEVILRDVSENSMVRHEAAEAIGAIGLKDSIPILKEFCKDSLREIRETCEIALRRLEESQRTDCISGDFLSVDPTPSFKDKNTKELSKILMDDSCDLYDRYRALFSLRNRVSMLSQLSNDKNEILEALEPICQALILKNEGSLFTHEVAFVLGQLQRPESSPFSGEDFGG